jgi:choline dehydrogenase
MLSGVGYREQLSSHGIKTLHHLPGVGKNLQDRYEVGIVSELKQNFSLLKGCGSGVAGDVCLRDYRIDAKNSVYGANGPLIGLIKRSIPWKRSPDLFIFAVLGDFRGHSPGHSTNLLNKHNRFRWVVLKAHTANRAGGVKLPRRINCKFPVKGEVTREIWQGPAFSSDAGLGEFVMNEA